MIVASNQCQFQGGWKLLKTGNWRLENWKLETDSLLRGVERNSLVAGVAMTAAALFLRPRPQLAVGVAAGAVLVGVSYFTLKRGVTMLAAVAARAPDAALQTRGIRGKVARELWKLVLRYALLALLAYVMIARLRLHPWGLLAGASSVVAGVSVEAVRLVMTGRGGPRPR